MTPRRRRALRRHDNQSRASHRTLLAVLPCPSCGQQNPEGFRFCGVCGAPLAPTPGREVRKTVTVLFADVTGSTALGERLDPESLRRVMSRFFEEMKGVLERHGGTVEKFIGDAVMAVFGVPTLHEDDALRALHAASAMRERLVSLNAELDRDFGVRLEARIGVNTGEVVTGEAASGERLATGDAINVAARLEQAAVPGEILLGAQTLELARDALEVEPVEPLPLKGKTDPVAAYRLLRVLEGAPSFERRLDAPLVGRREELARVRGAFDQAVLGRSCRLVTVFGPPGIGKSRLALEVAADLHGEADVFSGRCLPYGEGITFWPLREIFVAAGAEDELDAALATGAPEEIFWAVRKALEVRARERPLVLVVEDVHWAEPTLLDLIDHLADWTRDAQILLLCSARPELLDERPAWGAGRQNAETLTLQPLDESEADELIESRLGGVQLEEEARARIRRVAEGNPLFVEQLLAMLAEGGDADRVPPTMHALLGARLDALPGDERDLLERAAVVGLEFEWEALGELAPDGRRPPGGQLAALVRKELIRPHELIKDTFRFRHMLIRDAAYERIPKGLRSDLHERFAGWLDGRGEDFEEIVGYHLEQAYRCVAELGPAGHRAQTLAEQAAERLAASGRRAYARDDMHAASNLLERATALLPADDRRRLELLPSLGRALTEAAEMERAESVLSEAVERGRATGERAVTAYGAVARLNLRLFTTPQKSYEESSLEVEEAIRVFEEVGDAAGTARALGVRGMFRLWQGGTEAAIKDLERAAQYARQVDDRPHEADILRYVLVAILFGPTPVEDALERVEEIRSRTGTNRTLEVTLLRTRGQLEAMQGNFDSARNLIAQGKALAEELGLVWMLVGGIPIQAAYIELLAGDASAAERELRPAWEALERLGSWGDFVAFAYRLADALFLQRRDDEALRLTELAEGRASRQDVETAIGWRRVRAKVLARRGEPAEGERLAREAIALAARTDYLHYHAQGVADLAEVLRLSGRSKESAAVAKEAIRLYEKKGNIVAARALRGFLAELAGV
jgi:class 3 adenylate cyclase/tetratricopeptide (TPR) repeat protein